MPQQLKHKKFILPAIIISVISVMIVSIMTIPIITSEKTPNEFVIEKTSFLSGTTLGGTITIEGTYLTMIIQSSPAYVPIRILLENKDRSYTWEKEIKGDQTIIIDNIKDRFLDLKIQNNAEKSVSFKAVIRDETPLTIVDLEEREAISLIKKQYPQLRDFPSDELPPKTIRVEKSIEGMYVIFETQGSGYPIIEATCFLVDDSKTVNLIGKYTPQGAIDMNTNISFKTCS